MVKETSAIKDSKTKPHGSEPKPIENGLTSLVGSLVAQFLQESIDEGKEIEIRGLGIKLGKKDQIQQSATGNSS